MSVTQFNKDEMIASYATRHLKTDPGIQTVYYLPGGAPEREIRFLEVNDLLAVREDDALEPIDFGIDIGGMDYHALMVLDVTPAQWEKIRGGIMELPDSWSLEGAIAFHR